jgi:ribosomal protein S30
MTIGEANNTLKNRTPKVSAKPAAKLVALVKRAPNAASLKQRVVTARKQADEVLVEARKLRAFQLAKQVRALNERMTQLEKELSKI